LDANEAVQVRRERHADAVQQAALEADSINVRMLRLRRNICNSKREVCEGVFDRAEREIADLKVADLTSADLIQLFWVAAFDFGGVVVAPPLLHFDAAFGVRFVVRPDLLESKAVFLDQWILRQLLHPPAVKFAPQAARSLDMCEHNEEVFVVAFKLLQ